MRVMVTGGTGFVGSHCVRALHAAGHDVVLLAREQARVAGAIEPLGVPADACEVVVGDLLEPATVDRALDGVDAVLHAANVYSLNARDAELMQRVNVEGTSTVLTAAAERGLDPIVHVSSGVVLLPSEELTSSSPVGDPYGPYSRSKVAAEAVAQQVRDAGGSVVIT